MDLNDYQNAARRTAVYAEHHRVIYPALGLASEAGEVAGKIKKVLRDQGGDFAQAPTDALKDELGDVLWYVAVLAADLGLSPGPDRRQPTSPSWHRAKARPLGGAGDVPLNRRLPILAREARAVERSVGSSPRRGCVRCRPAR